MSISIGIYDLFSYLIPGMLYLYIINEFLRFMNLKFIDILTLTQGGQSAIGLIGIVFLLIGAYFTGHVFESVRSLLLDRRLYHDGPSRALIKIRRRLSHSNLEISFHYDEWSIYQEVIKVRNGGPIWETESLKATAFMMRNFSFGAFLYGILQLLQIFRNPNGINHSVQLVIGITISVLTYLRARRFDEWYYRTVYSQALAYGSSLKEVLENPTPVWKIDRKPITEKDDSKKKTGRK